MLKLAMIILGIETSCDETAAALVENGTKILANTVATSVAKHAQTGGIIPEIAAREQQHFMIPVIEETLKEAQMDSSHVDAIAVTSGPGLIGSLLVGVETAKALSFAWQKPIVPVNHLIGHLYANWLIEGKEPPEFPLLALVVSGGHTDIVLMENHGQIKWLGGTRDDAAGECFDKTARLLNLGYPGGPAISQAANSFFENQKVSEIKLPRPMINENNFDFSFSGLKTAVLREVNFLKEKGLLNEKKVQELAYEIQEAITDVLVSKALKVAAQYKIKALILAGGVTANSRLRDKIQEATKNKDFKLYIPPFKLCTDNAAYIASAAHFNYEPKPWQEIDVLPGLAIEGEI